MIVDSCLNLLLAEDVIGSFVTLDQTQQVNIKENLLFDLIGSPLLCFAVLCVAFAQKNTHRPLY